MRSRFRSPTGPNDSSEGRNLELVRVRRTQRDAGDEGRELRGRPRRRGGRGRSRSRRPAAPPPPPAGLLGWIKRLFGGEPKPATSASRSHQEVRTFEEFQRHFQLQFADPDLLKLALTHRSYLSVTGQGPRASNERLEFLGDSVLGLVTSEFLYRLHPDEHEGELTKNKSLLVSKAILSRRALAMGLGRFVLMSHSEVESGGRQRLSILADAFEAVIGAIYLDQGFEAAREFIHRWLLREAGEIVADKRHTNYKSHLQEYVQSTWRTHPVYRIRSEIGPDHSKHFLVEVMVGKRNLGEGRGRNKKEAEQAAARDALEKAGAPRESARPPRPEREERRRPADEYRRSGEERPMRAAPAEEIDTETSTDAPDLEPAADDDEALSAGRRRRRGRRGGRGRRREEPAVPVERPAPPAAEVTSGRLATPSRRLPPIEPAAAEEPMAVEPAEVEPPPRFEYDDEHEEVGRPEGPEPMFEVDTARFETQPSTPGGSRFESEPPAEEELSQEVEFESDEEESPALSSGDEPSVEPRPAPGPMPGTRERAPTDREKPSSQSGRNFGRRRGRK